MARPPFLAGEVLERFIGIRDTIGNLTRERPPRMIGVTSSTQLEGKTRVAVCLSLVFAMDSRMRVLLVDGNLRSPGIAPLFRIPPGPGLTGLILEDLPVAEVVQTAAGFPLHLIPAGASNLTPSEIYSHPRFARRLAEIRESFDLAIIDTPGVKRYPDFELFGKHLDGAVFVFEADKTQLPLIQETKSRIEAAGVPILGVVINRVRNPIPDFLNKRFGLD